MAFDSITTLSEALISILLSSNIFLMKRLSQRVEKPLEDYKSLLSHVVNISSSVNKVCAEMNEVRDDVRQLRKLETELDFLKMKLHSGLKKKERG